MQLLGGVTAQEPGQWAPHWGQSMTQGGYKTGSGPVRVPEFDTALGQPGRVSQAALLLSPDPAEGQMYLRSRWDESKQTGICYRSTFLWLLGQNDHF